MIENVVKAETYKQLQQDFQVLSKAYTASEVELSDLQDVLQLAWVGLVMSLDHEYAACNDPEDNPEVEHRCLPCRGIDAIVRAFDRYNAETDE